MAKANKFYGTGRRKSSVARVYVNAGEGKITVNGRDVNEYMPYATLVQNLKQPLTIAGVEGKYDALKVAGMLTRNARAKERKKYGLKAARRAPQFSKR